MSGSESHSELKYRNEYVIQEVGVMHVGCVTGTQVKVCEMDLH